MQRRPAAVPLPVLYIEDHRKRHFITTLNLRDFQSLEELRVHLRTEVNRSDEHCRVRVRFKIWDDVLEFGNDEELLGQDAAELFRECTWVDVVPEDVPFHENVPPLPDDDNSDTQPPSPPTQAEEEEERQQTAPVSYVGLDVLCWERSTAVSPLGELVISQGQKQPFHDSTTEQVPKQAATRMTKAAAPSSPQQFFREKIIPMASAGPSGEEAVVTFDGIATLAPTRGLYDVELHISFLRLQGQADDFEIQYNNVLRIFLLPKPNQSHFYVVVTLDSPIRKGQTLYPHVVLEFETGGVIDCSRSLNEEILNTKFENRLRPTYKGLVHEDFTTILRGLSGAKVTRSGKFRSCQDGYAVKSALKAEDGVLYPLEMGLVFLPKPPTLVSDEEIEYVEFERHCAGGTNMHYFHLLVKLKSGQEHRFRNIERNEYHNLFDFISGKGLKIMNLGDFGTMDGVAGVLQNTDDDAVHPHLERIRNEAGGDESD